MKCANVNCSANRGGRRCGDRDPDPSCSHRERK